MKRKSHIEPIRIAITGHRDFAKTLYYPTTDDHHPRFVERINFVLKDLLLFSNPDDKVIFLHGCARGVDLWFGEYAMNRNFFLELYLPFPFKQQTYHGKFSPHHFRSLKRQIEYPGLKRKEIVGKRYNPQVYGKRNRLLVDNCDILFTYYERERSGSGHAARYAHSLGKPVFDLYNYTSQLFSLDWILGEDLNQRRLRHAKRPERIYCRKRQRSSSF